MALRLFELNSMNEDELAIVMWENFASLVDLDNDSRMIQFALDERSKPEQYRITEKFNDLIFDSMREYSKLKKNDEN